MTTYICVYVHIYIYIYIYIYTSIQGSLIDSMRLIHKPRRAWNAKAPLLSAHCSDFWERLELVHVDFPYTLHSKRARHAASCSTVRMNNGRDWWTTPEV